jgi:hypothetical protein
MFENAWLNFFGLFFIVIFIGLVINWRISKNATLLRKNYNRLALVLILQGLFIYGLILLLPNAPRFRSISSNGNMTLTEIHDQLEDQNEFLIEVEKNINETRRILYSTLMFMGFCFPATIYGFTKVFINELEKEKAEN